MVPLGERAIHFHSCSSSASPPNHSVIFPNLLVGRKHAPQRES